MSRILKIDEFNNYEVSSQNDFMALSELDPSEGEGATYALSEKSKRMAVYVKDAEEEALLKELCFKNGYRRFSGGDAPYDFGKCEVPGYGRTLDLNEFVRKFA